MADLSAILEDDASRLFSILAEASIRGDHLVICRRELSAWIEAQDTFGSHVRSHFRRLTQEFTQSASLLAASPPRMSIVIGNELERVGRTWMVGHKRVLAGALLFPANLIVEDSDSDGSFFEEILPIHARASRLPGLSFNIVNGGGSGTYKRLRRSIEDGRVSICVCDHDMLAMFTSYSATLLKCIAEGRRHSFVGDVLALPAREIENIIPLQIVLDTMGLSNDARYQRVSELIAGQAECASGECLWLFFDVKEGINADRLRKACKDARAQDWVVARYRLADWQAVDTVDLPGFGDSVVRGFLESGRSMGEMHRFMREAYWSQHFQDFFSLLCWFFAARRPERV